MAFYDPLKRLHDAHKQLPFDLHCAKEDEIDRSFLALTV